jgi:hypothetical protein
MPNANWVIINGGILDTGINAALRTQHTHPHRNYVPEQ